MRTFDDMPDRIRALPTDHRGFPVPYFVAWQNGIPCFPVLDPDRMRRCMTHSRCWICGDRITAFKTFVIGPMCVCNRVSAEPPSHLACARFAARYCPFMSQPLAKRADLAKYGETEAPGGIMIERNPGVTALWTTKRFTIEQEGGKPLWRIGPPESVEFWAKGRKAKRSEVVESIRTGLPLLQRIAEAEGALPYLQRQVDIMEALLDKVAWPEEQDEPRFGDHVTGDDLPDVDLASFEEAAQ